MAITSSSIGSKPLSEAALVTIELVDARPDTGTPNNPPLAAGRMAGFYNPQTGRVELYVTSTGGTYWVRCS